jgi:hypothetical protein
MITLPKENQRQFAGRVSSNSPRLLLITATSMGNATAWLKRAVN